MLRRARWRTRRAASVRLGGLAFPPKRELNNDSRFGIDRFVALRCSTSSIHSAA